MDKQLAPEERSRLLKRLSPNGTPDDVPEIWLTRVGNTIKIEIRQTRKDGAARSVFLTFENWDELLELGDDAQD